MTATVEEMPLVQMGIKLMLGLSQLAARGAKDGDIQSITPHKTGGVFVLTTHAMRRIFAGMECDAAFDHDGRKWTLVIDGCVFRAYPTTGEGGIGDVWEVGTFTL